MVDGGGGRTPTVSQLGLCGVWDQRTRAWQSCGLHDMRRHEAQEWPKHKRTLAVERHQLPVLTYGSPVWFNGQKKLRHPPMRAGLGCPLIRGWIMGAFCTGRTTPPYINAHPAADVVEDSGPLLPFHPP
jgi:hypothetical protein